MKWDGETLGKGVTGTNDGPVSDPFPACTDNEKVVTASASSSEWLTQPNNTLWRRALLEIPDQRDIKCPVDKSGKTSKQASLI